MNELTPRIMRSSVVLFVIAVLPACGNLIDLSCDSTKGEKGASSFAYSGCRAVGKNALAAGGARSSISVTGPAFTSFASSNPMVATFARGSSPTDIAVTSGSAGTTELQLLDAGNAVVDQVAVTVKSTTTLAFDKGWPDSQMGPTIVAGPDETLHTITMDGANSLVGTGAVTFKVSGTLKLGVTGLFGDSATFTGTVGSGTITADCDNAHLSIPVTVIDAASVDSLKVSPTSVQMNAGDKVTVVASIGSKGNSVYAGGCNWTASSPNVVISQAGTTTSIGAPADVPYSVAAKGTGSYTVTCTIFNGMTQVVQVKVN